MNALQVALVKADREAYKHAIDNNIDIAKIYRNRNNVMSNIISAQAEKSYEGTRYIPWYILNDLIYKIGLVEDDARSIAVFDKITFSILKTMLKCRNVTVFDKGEGFLESRMKFYATLGNPPYQDPTKPRHKMWTKFIEHAINNSDVCAFIAPKLASQLLSGIEVDHTTLKNYYIHYYNGYNVDRYFSVGSDFCSFIISKTKTDTITVVTENGEEEWPQHSYIPYNANKILASIISKTMNFKNDYKRSAARVDEADGEYKCIQKITKNGPHWVTSDKKHPDADKPKMLYPTLGAGEYLDITGNVMPTTSFVCYIPVSHANELNDLVELQNSNLFKFLVKSFSSMRSPRDFVWKNIAKNRVELSDEEIAYIDNME